MCFDTCVAVDPSTGTKHIPASARIDPSQLPFYPAPASNDTQVKVTVFHLGTVHSYRQAWADDAWDQDLERRQKKASQPVHLPLLSALIEHEPTGEKWLWDLGACNNYDILPAIFSSGSVKFLVPELNHHGQLKNVLLNKFGVATIDEIGLTGIILSHAHFDHYGNLLDFPTDIPVFVGAGTLDWIGGGDEAAQKGEKGHASFPSSFLKDRTFIETDQVKAKAAHGHRVKETKVGPFERAWDWFGDGSLFIASAEGHCPGHQVMLAKTSHHPTPSWVLLSGDAAHQQALYHPLPPPLELGAESLCSTRPHYHAVYRSEDDRRATPGFFDHASAHAIVDRPIPDDKAACMQEFPDKAMQTLAALSRLEACHDVMVVLAHELEFTHALDLKEGDGVVVNDWRNQGWKEKKIQMGKRARDQLASL